MPKKGQSSTAVERLNGLRNRSNEQPVKPPRMKRVTDENLESQPKKSKRAAFGDLTNVSFNAHLQGLGALFFQHNLFNSPFGRFDKMTHLVSL